MDAISRPKLAKAMIEYTILIRITLFQIPDKGENVWGWVDAILYMLTMFWRQRKINSENFLNYFFII